MDELTWELLTQIYDRVEAEMIKAALEALDIPAELVQEGIGRWVVPVTVGSFGEVHIFVPKEKIAEARAWLNAYDLGNLEE
ncbi:MAG: hypothetical protein B5M51_03835 [Anaerolinea sp. 4484_236]|nr:MAG: hypothetical protein B5M51_03835 [Anaerolinea sp. 4484_236]